MLAARPHLEPRRVAGADSVMVREIYLSLQGESSHQGLLCSFVRLTGCHLRCTYCDSAFAFHGGERLAVAEVVRRVLGLGAPRVEVTGGEPLLQPGVYPLLEQLLGAGLTVLLETSGAIDVRLVPAGVHKIVDLKTPSSGECDRNDLRVLDSMTAGDELKFVIGTREDYLWARAQLAAHRLASRPFGLLFGCVHGALAPRLLAEWIVADRLPVRFQLQQHKVVWPADARGV
ncbi:MAG TPA: radical SAM protein [Myxococcaceae bacterium]|jgi:7-carboxy-7-deazaguanine synthase|nr:radical SAM protein [Myxococcaceae bacterium]